MPPTATPPGFENLGNPLVVEGNQLVALTRPDFAAHQRPQYAKNCGKYGPCAIPKNLIRMFLLTRPALSCTINWCDLPLVSVRRRRVISQGFAGSPACVATGGCAFRQTAAGLHDHFSLSRVIEP